MSLKTSARAYLRDAVSAFNNAPAEVALAILTAALLSYTIDRNQPFEVWVQSGVATFIAFAFAWCATLLKALGALTNSQRWGVTIAGTVFAAAYLLFAGPLELESEGWRAFMLCIGVTLLVFAAPAWIRSDQPASLRLRRINGRFVLRAIGIGLYGLALFGGLALALGAIDKLFELKLKSDIYGHTFGWIMLVLVPWVIVGGLDSYAAPLDEESDVARVVHRLAAFLVPPLLVLYYLILYVYAARIAITGELPKNLVSPMVLAAGLLTALAAILFDPAPGDARIGHRALRFAPALFLPLVPLGIWALAARIGEYGWTEFRLLRVILLMLLLVLAILATFELVRRRPFSLRVIPALLGVVVILGVIGPWSVLRAARRDQQTRLAEALRAARVDVARPVSPDTTRREVPRELFDKINDIGAYLQIHFGDSALIEVTRNRLNYVPMRWTLAETLRLIVAVNDTMPWITHGQLPMGSSVPVGTGQVYRINTRTTNVRRDGSGVELYINGEVLRANLETLIAQVPRTERRRGPGNLPRVAIPVFDMQNRQRGEMILLAATVEAWRDSVRVTINDGVLIVR